MTKLNAIDLGLSVLWADKNIYADEPMEIGKEMSVNHAFYKLIDDDEFDGNWRLPTLEEIQELKSSKLTKWTPVMENGKQTGWNVKGITGDNPGSIVLPFAHHENSASTLYWSGNRMGEVKYHCMMLNGEGCFCAADMEAVSNCVRLVRNRNVKLTADENAELLYSYLQISQNPETELTEDEEYVAENYNPLVSKDTSEIESALGIDHNAVINLWIEGSIKMSKDVYCRLVFTKRFLKH